LELDGRGGWRLDPPADPPVLVHVY
jgi:hypothetical protein